MKALSDSEIFKAVVALEPERRSAFLDEACAGNRPLRDEVESLLRAHDPEGSFLRAPVGEVTIDRPITERPGTTIGPYKIREQIGEGGFGVVYVAEQEKPVRRKVALKIIKPGMDTKDVIARFEAERQALALMDHPNVARVLDAGATAPTDGGYPGRPYFVMELVQGVAITEFCDKNSLPTRERLLLFTDVCRAVQHAHQKGIIHRDLKPSNIMVTLHDGKPVAKVIDFGVSKALSQHLTEKSIYTAYGQMIGTPSYMSPEQAEMSGLGIDTRSDIYSLGVLLYELLTGQTPLDARRLRVSAYAEILRIIKEEEPPRPSLKISTLGEQATVIAQQRHTDVGQLRRDLAGELDWIVMKCLEKDRTRRYETASGLARDIDRYLRDEPVEACPPSAAYRMSKYWRRNRGLLSTAAAFAVLLVIGTAISSWLAVRAKLAERRVQAALTSEQAARKEAERAREQAEGFSRRLRQATQIAHEGLDFYNRGNWAAAHQQFARAEQIEPDLRSIYLFRGDLYTTLGLWDRAARDYDRRLELANRGSDSGTLYRHAVLKLNAGDEPGYRRICEEAVRQFSNSMRNDDTHSWLRACVVAPQPVGDPNYLAERSDKLVAAWYVPWVLSASALAHLRASHYEQTAARSRELMALGPDKTGIHRAANLYLSMALFHLGQSAEARQELAQADEMIEDWTRQMADGAPGAMPIEWYKWLELSLLHREATLLITGTPLPEDPRVVMVRERSLAAIRYGDALTFMESGREQVRRQAWDEAAANYAKVLDQLPQAFRSGSQEQRFCLEMVAQPAVFARLVALRPRDARLWYARGRLRAATGELLPACDDYAQTLALQNQEIEKASKAQAQSVRRGHWHGIVRLELAALRLLSGDEAGYRELCAPIHEQEVPRNDAFWSCTFSRTLTLRAGAGEDPVLAVRLAKEGAAAEPGVAWWLFALGLAEYRGGQWEDAVQHLEESLRVHPAWVGRGQNFVVLAMACQQLGRHDEARSWLAKTKAWGAEIEANKAKLRYDYAASDYLCDLLTVDVLLPEAEQLLTAKQSPENSRVDP